MNNLLLLNKPVGLTPLQAIESYKKLNPEYTGITMSYAGRLDPMAEGLLLILVGEQNQRREKYLGLDKVYEVEMLCGVATDSHDVLGLVVETSEKVRLDGLVDALKAHTGSITQQFPVFSSKTVQGKPLYWWAREGKLDDIEIPSEKRIVHSIEVLNLDAVKMREMEKSIEDKLSRLQGGKFRQAVIAKDWEKYFKETKRTELPLLTLRVHSSTGTFMRGLVDSIGKSMKVPCLAYSIKRTKVGNYSLKDAEDVM